MLNTSSVTTQPGLQQTCGLIHFQLQSTFSAHNLETQIAEYKLCFNSKMIMMLFKSNMTILGPYFFNGETVLPGCTHSHENLGFFFSGLSILGLGSHFSFPSPSLRLNF